MFYWKRFCASTFCVDFAVFRLLLNLCCNRHHLAVRRVERRDADIVKRRSVAFNIWRKSHSTDSCRSNSLKKKNRCPLTRQGSVVPQFLKAFSNLQTQFVVLTTWTWTWKSCLISGKHCLVEILPQGSVEYDCCRMLNITPSPSLIPNYSMFWMWIWGDVESRRERI